MGKILSGLGQLGLGIIVIVCLLYVVPSIMNISVISTGLGSTLKGIIWVGVMAVVLIALIVRPISIIYEGIRDG